MRNILFIITILLASQSFGNQFKCVETNGPVGVTRSLELTQIGETADWQLSLYSTAVAPNAEPKLILSSVLTVFETEDVAFFLKNEADDVTFNIYMDELYMTYLYLPGQTESITFDCE